MLRSVVNSNHHPVGIYQLVYIHNDHIKAHRDHDMHLIFLLLGSIVKKLISFMEAAVVTEEAVEILEPAVILVLVLIRIFI
jgi:hypothetical protein